MSASPESSGAAARRISQRQPQRRKTRCDRTIPCNNCEKRGLPERCHIEQVIPSKSLNNVSQLKQLRAEMLNADAALEDRIAGIEEVVRTYMLARGVGVELGKRKRADSVEQLDEDARGEDDEVPEGDKAEAKDDEAEAAATLEFLAIGRVRQKSPGGIAEEADWDLGVALDGEAETADGDTAEAPGRAVSLLRAQPTTLAALAPASTTAYEPDRRIGAYRRAVRRDVLARLPPAAIGRALVRHDVEHVSWMHCCYHGPTFQGESDLFWSELGADDVEVNWSFVALLFGVLMSALHHLPETTTAILFPDQDMQVLMGLWFDACMSALSEADWMRSHSLYAVQCIAVIISPANHLGKADLYFTLLGAAIRVAQALNLHRLGPDAYDARPVRAGVLVAREVRKRVWWQLVIQDSFHVAFNGACSIHGSQFDTPPPLHCTDDPLGADGRVQRLSTDVPTIDSHTCQLLKLAMQINRAYTSASRLRAVPYDTLLKIDADMAALRSQAPVWMRDERAPLPANAPSWLEWQRRAYIVSAAHKVIVLHRPYLGRAFRGDARYSQSREAHTILRLFKERDMPEFRRTWTVLAHVVAACLVVLLDISQRPGVAPADAVQPVADAVAALRALESASTIARKGVAVLSPLADTANRTSAAAGAAAGRAAFAGRAEQELQRALDIFRRPSVGAVSAVGAGTGASAAPDAAAAAAAAAAPPPQTPPFAAGLEHFPLSPTVPGLDVEDDAFVWMAGGWGDDGDGGGGDALDALAWM